MTQRPNPISKPSEWDGDVFWMDFKGVKWDGVVERGSIVIMEVLGSCQHPDIIEETRNPSS